MADEEVSILVTLKNIAAFISQTKEAGAALKGIGTSAEEGSAKASGSVGKIDSVVSRVRMAAQQGVTSLALMGQHAVSSGGMIGKSLSKIEETAKKPLLGGGVAGTVAGMFLGGISVKGIKDAITSTTDLAKSSESLHQVTGMSVKDAASWQAVTQANGVSQRAFALALKQTANTTVSFQSGLKAGTDTFNKLGITMSDVKAHGGDMNAMFGEVIDKFNKMPAGVDKTKVATQLFGRNWQSLLPMLSQGSGALAAERTEAEKMGVTMGGNASQAALKLHAAQVSLSLATQGLKVQFAENLAPALITIINSLLKLYASIAPTLMPLIKSFGGVIASIAGELNKTGLAANILKGILVGFIAAWVAGKVAIIGARVAMVAIHGVEMAGKAIMLAYKVAVVAVRAVMLLWQATIWLVNAALDANPIAIVIIAIIALIAAVVLIATHFKQFKQIVSDVFNAVVNAISSAINWVINFLKKTWPIILVIFTGPLGAVVLAFTKYRDQTLSIFNGLWNSIKSIFSGVLNAIEQPFKDAWAFLSNLHIKITTTHIGPVSVPSGISVSGAQYGGTVPQNQPVMVGERGPEIMNLPRGTNITPIPRGGVTPVTQNAGMPPLTVSVQIQRKEIANAVAKFNNDQLARK